LASSFIKEGKESKIFLQLAEMKKSSYEQQEIWKRIASLINGECLSSFYF
jgi:hypothetical protein